MKVGLVLLLEGNASLGVPRYRQVRDLARQAEAAGFDSIWLYDHLLFRPEGAPPIGQWECFTFLAALAEATERIGLGVLVACTAFRNPALLAKIATALDEVSDGRFTLGLGAGWNPAEFAAFGLPFDHRVARFEQALRIIVPLLREGQVDFAGSYYQANGCVDLPRGPRPHGPPLVVGAFGPRMQRLAAQHADGLNGAGPAALRAACAAAGRDEATLALSTPLWVAFPDLGPIPEHMRESSFDSALGVAERMRALAADGFDEIMIDLRPNTPTALGRLAQSLEQYRGTAY